VLGVAGAVMLVDLVRRLAATVALVEQQLFLVEALGAIAALGWMLGRPDRRAFERARPRLIALGLLAFVVAAAAAVAGHVRLALFIGAGIVGSAYVALALHAGVTVVGALIGAALREGPLRSLWMVQRHRALLERRLRGVVRTLALGAWTVLTLHHFGLWSIAADWAEAALTAELERGSVRISLGAVLAFAITVAATVVLSRIVRFALREEIAPRMAPARALPYAVTTIVHYSVVVTGVLLGLAVLGVDLTKITIVASALGVGIGFGLKDLVNNVICGLVVLSERRINVGDAVQIGDVGGQVEQLGLRACTVRTWEGAEVIVPNASLVTEKVANWTLSDRLRRIDLPVRVAYGTSPEKVADILLGVARAHARVLAEPAPVVLFLGYGESEQQFELRAWTGRFEDWPVTRSELAATGYAALAAAGIDVPLPQREVRLRPA
jgi:small-conductance mechanosensitive channel